MTPEEVLQQAGILAYLIRIGHTGKIVRDENGCAIWPRGKTTGGYGTWYPAGEAEYVHVAVYRACVDEIPDGYHIDHVWDQGCRSRACFWPEHLEAVTPAENARRAGLARRPRGPRGCGHSWDENRPGRTDCAVCHREDAANRKAPAKAAYRERLAIRTVRIRELADAGLSQSEIGAEVGCSQRTVSRTLLGQGKKY